MLTRFTTLTPVSWSKSALAAVAAVGVAMFMRYGLDPLLGDELPYITLYPAVLITAILCGGGSGMLALALGAAACGGKDDNANNTNTARNANAATTAATPAATATPTPVSASEDTSIKNKTEAALSKAGVSGVTVEVNQGVVTLKGDVPRAKWQDVMKAANESGAKRVMNQMNDKK